jgi:hypothetical protein
MHCWAFAGYHSYNYVHTSVLALITIIKIKCGLVCKCNVRLHFLRTWGQCLTTSVSPRVNFSPRGGWTLPPGVNFAPWGELCPLGGLFTPSFTPRGAHSLMVRRTKGRTEGLHPWEITSPLGKNFTSWGPISTLGVKLKTGVRAHSEFRRNSSELIPGGEINTRLA